MLEFLAEMNPAVIVWLIAIIFFLAFDRNTDLDLVCGRRTCSDACSYV